MFFSACAAEQVYYCTNVSLSYWSGAVLTSSSSGGSYFPKSDQALYHGTICSSVHVPQSRSITAPTFLCLIKVVQSSPLPRVVGHIFQNPTICSPIHQSYVIMIAIKTEFNSLGHAASGVTDGGQGCSSWQLRCGPFFRNGPP